MKMFEKMCLFGKINLKIDLNNMTTQQAYINGFVKRASEYGFNESETKYFLKKLAEGYSSNEIQAEINAINPNVNRPAGSAAMLDFPVKGSVPPKIPAYTPTNPKVPIPAPVILNHVPGVGRFVGPLARFASGDMSGGILGTASTAALGLGPAGIPLSKGLEWSNDILDAGKHILRKSDAMNAFENKNRPVRG